MALCIVLLGISTPPALSLGDKMWESGNMKCWGDHHAVHGAGQSACG